MTQAETETVQLRAHQRVVKKLGAWTTARRFDVRASRSIVVLDLLLPELEPGDIKNALDIDHATVKLLVPDGAVIDDNGLRRVGRGRIRLDGRGSPRRPQDQARRRDAKRRGARPPRRHRNPLAAGIARDTPAGAQRPSRGTSRSRSLNRHGEYG